MNAQENYEQLKRRNRRRLVGALMMVLIAVILLVIMINHRYYKPPQAPQLNVVSNAASQITAVNTVSVTNASQQMDMVPNNVILEPVNNSPSSAPVTVEVSPSPQITETSRDKLHADIPVNITPQQAQIIQQQQSVNQATGTVQVEHNKTSVVKPPVAVSTIETPSKNTIEQHNKVTTHKVENDTPKKMPITTGQHRGKENITKTPATLGTKPTTNGKNRAIKNTTSGSKFTSPLDKLTPQQILENKAAKRSNVTPAPKQLLSIPVTNTAPVERMVIQVGAYTTEAQAKVIQQRMANIGIATNISYDQTTKGTLFRVRSGVYNSRTQALKNLEKIQATGLNGFVVGL